VGRFTKSDLRLHRATREGGQAIVGNVTQGAPATAPQKPANLTPALADARKPAMTLIGVIAPARGAASDSCRGCGLLVVSAASRISAVGCSAGVAASGFLSTMSGVVHTAAMAVSSR
jgi:hypothetical protein